MDNTTRSLVDTVSIDGWIAEFDDNGQANVHVDVVFREGIFGDDPNARLRFNIKLKRAQVLLRPYDDEPVKVVKSTVERQYETVKGRKTTTKKTTRTNRLAGKLSISNPLSPSGGIDAETAKDTASTDAVETTQDISKFLVQHFMPSDGIYAWDIEPSEASPDGLDGAPWNANDSPRLAVRKNPSCEVDDQPAMVVEISCLRKDIEIYGLEEKEAPGRQPKSKKKISQANIAAAEQIIKGELMKSGFLAQHDMSEETTRLVIADKILVEDR